jgi:hypothetical protein
VCRSDITCTLTPAYFLLSAVISGRRAPFPLLDLPDACLLAVLQCCAVSDQRSVISAAQAHSRLHQAAVEALCSINAVVWGQQQVDSVLLYLDRHGNHVRSVKLWGPPIGGAFLTLRQLPPSMKQHSLDLERWQVQLQPGHGFQGVLGAAAAGLSLLKQLRLCDCQLLDGVASLEAALQQLPALEHLSISAMHSVPASCELVLFPTGVLQQLTQLTYLELDLVGLQGPDQASPALQPLQALTRLAHLRLKCVEEDTVGGADGVWPRVTASMLSGAGSVTHLALNCAVFELDALGHMPKLQHLVLAECTFTPPAGAAGLAVSPPAATYTALTASSNLQHLSISNCTLPEGVWPHLLPIGRKLLHLTSLDISKVKLPGGAALAFDGSRIMSCCPSLQLLNMRSLQYEGRQLTHLLGLSGLQKLHLVTGTGTLDPPAFDTEPALPTQMREALQVLCQLKGLRELDLVVDHPPTPLLLRQLCQLQHLTALTYENKRWPALLKYEVGCFFWGCVLYPCMLLVLLLPQTPPCYHPGCLKLMLTSQELHTSPYFGRHHKIMLPAAPVNAPVMHDAV